MFQVVSRLAWVLTNVVQSDHDFVAEEISKKKKSQEKYEGNCVDQYLVKLLFFLE